MPMETQRAISPSDFEDKTLIVENRDVEALGQYVGPDFPEHRTKLHCYRTDEKIISIGPTSLSRSNEQQIAQVYKEYHPDVPWPKQLIVFRTDFLVAAPVLAMISNATHNRGHQFDVTVICRSFKRDAWINLIDSPDLPFVDKLSIVYELETSEPYVPNLTDQQDHKLIKQLQRDFSMPSVIQHWAFGKNVEN